MRKLPFRDDWILTNCGCYGSYRELAEEHNKLFGTSFSREQMKNHAGLILGVKYSKYFYTKEMEKWIRREYPKAGTSDEKAKAFNSEFGTNKTGQDLKEKARLMGASLSHAGQQEYKRRSAAHIVGYNTTVRAKPAGYVGRISNGYPQVKNEHGEWVPQGRYEYAKQNGMIPKGSVVIFLDGDNSNVSRENLAAIPKGHQGLMTVHGFWSKEPELTRAGVLWVDLYSRIKRKGG